MGLDVRVTGLLRKETYHGCYSTFNNYRKEIAARYDRRIGRLYEKMLNKGLTALETRKFRNLCPDGLYLFLTHSEEDGKFTPKECKEIYNILKDINIEGSLRLEKSHRLWLSMFEHCYKRRVNMYFE